MHQDLRLYDHNWVVIDFLKMYLKNTSQRSKRKAAAKAKADVRG
jgi:hypothetical protein